MLCKSSTLYDIAKWCNYCSLGPPLSGPSGTLGSHRRVQRPLGRSDRRGGPVREGLQRVSSLVYITFTCSSFLDYFCKYKNIKHINHKMTINVQWIRCRPCKTAMKFAQRKIALPSTLLAITAKLTLRLARFMIFSKLSFLKWKNIILHTFQVRGVLDPSGPPQVPPKGTNGVVIN